MLINGSESNAATSQYSMSPAFGNHRPGQKGLYNGSFGATIDNSVFDARPYSLTGQQTPKDFYSRVTTMVTVGGPLRIPRVMPWGPNFFVAYQWTRNADAANQTGLVPDCGEKRRPLGPVECAGTAADDLQSHDRTCPSLETFQSVRRRRRCSIFIRSRTSPATRAITTRPKCSMTRTPMTCNRGSTRSSARRDQLYGGFGFRSSRADNTNLFGFVDTTDTLGIDTNVNWSHRYRHQTFVLLGYHLTRLRTEVRPEFAGHVNVRATPASAATIRIRKFGPPGLTFSSGICRAQRYEQRIQPKSYGCTFGKCVDRLSASQL